VEIIVEREANESRPGDGGPPTWPTSNPQSGRNLPATLTSGDFTDLIERCLTRLEDATQPPERADLFQRIGEAFRDGLADDGQALDAFVEAFSAAPGDPHVVAALEGQAIKTGRWEEVMDAAKALTSDPARDPVHRLAACVRLVDWYERPLSRPDLAEVYRVRLSELEGTVGPPAAPTQVSVAAPSSGSPSDVLSARARAAIADPHEAAGLFAAALELDPCSVEALLGLAELQERQFVRPQLAAPLLERALAVDPAHEGALDALERCYVAVRAWGDVASTLERRAERAPRGSRAELFARIAELREAKLADPDGAFRAYERACAENESDPGPVAHLARLSERAGDWVTAAAYRERLAAMTHDPRAKGQIHVTIGELLSPAERNPLRAKEHFEHAVVHDPKNTTAWQALQELAARGGDRQGAAFCLEKRAGATDGSRLKAQLFVDLARMREVSGDEEGTRSAYEAALAADATNEAAAHAMLVEYVGRAHWAGAAPLCELLINAAARDADPSLSFDLYRLATRIATELGNDERALLSAAAAVRLGDQDIRAREELVAVCHRMLHDPKALLRVREAIELIGAQPAGLCPTSMSKLADVQHAIGGGDAAVKTYRRALELDGGSPGALAGLAAASIARGDWEVACTCKERLAYRAADPNERYALLVEAAELWLHRASDLERAAAMFEQAALLCPTDRWLLHTMLSLNTQLGRWPQVAKLLRSIADLDETPVVKVKSVYAMAQVMRDKLGDRTHAALLFEEVLDLDPSRLDAFERIVRIHTEQKDWSGLVLAYERMVARALANGPANGGELLYQLHHQLGLIYRDRVGNADRAIQAFSAARAIKPEDTQERRIVSELYVLTDQLDKAVAETRAGLLADPLKPGPYHELYTLFLRQTAFDKAWCVADALAELGACTEQQAQYRKDYPPSPLEAIRGTVSPQAWASLISHPALDPTLSAIFALMTPAVAWARVHSLSARDQSVLLGQALTDVRSGSEYAAVAAIQNACVVLGHPPPALFRKAGTVALSVGLAPTPTIVLAPDAVEALPPATLPFLVGKRLAEQRPALLARAFFPSVTELSAILQTAIRFARRATSLGGRAGDVLSSAFDASILGAMSEADKRGLQKAVSGLLRTDAGTDELFATPDLARWSQMADLTATRAGLLLAGSVEVAKKGLLLERHYASDLAPRERLKELLAFAVSDEYAELRAAIGVSVEAAMRR